MEAHGKSVGVNKYWAGGCLCALLVGVGMRLVLSNPGANPILNNSEQFRPVPQIAHYMFQPLIYVAMVALLTFRVVRMRFVGLWSVFFSFIVGGISATILLGLR